MAKYNVCIPVEGSITIQVEAEDENSAKEAAWEKAEDLSTAAFNRDVVWEFGPSRDVNVEEE